MNKKTRYDWFLDCAAYLRLTPTLNLDTFKVNMWLTKQMSDCPIQGAEMRDVNADVLKFDASKLSFDVHRQTMGNIFVVYAISPEIGDLMVIPDGTLTRWFEEEIEGPF